MSAFDTGWCEVIVKRTSRRKSMAIRIKDGCVQVNVPKRTTAVDVHLLLENKRSWIENALNKHQIALQMTSKKIEEGELFLFQGKQYPLCFEYHSYKDVYISDDHHLTIVHPDFQCHESLFEQLLLWYQNEAIAYLTARTKIYAQQLGHFPNSIRIKSYRSRWGSCSSIGDIQYNWRLIMAPQEVIDYVVVHELCHLIEHNHSIRFWQLVSRLDEEYQHHRQWLKLHGDKLDLCFSKS